MSIETDTPIIPWIVCEQVANEAARLTNSELPLSLVSYLTARAEACYAKNKSFRREIRRRGNRGRDHLYMFARHWISAEINRQYPALFRMVPESFCLGLPA